VSERIRTIIVDDEPIARRHIRSLLGEHPEIEIIGECGNGPDAIAAIRKEHPELVLLDIQMPEIDGFGVVKEIGADRMPVVVFVSAFDEYALAAFEAHALDYIMKPVKRDRFHQTIRRAVEQIGQRGGGDLRGSLGRLLERIEAERRFPSRLAIKTEGRMLFLKASEIDWIETDGDLVKFHVGPQTYLHRTTLTRLEERLSPKLFLRIHRSIVVNVERVRELQPWFQGDYVLILADGTRLTSGRSYRERVRDFVARSS
jgi:two-component system LytT family response regulator